jgi:hypothetical protein
MASLAAIVVGYWSTNIGNSFFQLGAEYALKQVLPEARVMFVSDQPGYWTTRRGSPENALRLVEHLPLDYLVIPGPYLRPEFPGIWGRTLSALRDRGVKIIALGVGMMNYEAESIAKYRRWLGEYPPYVFATRDSFTYASLGDLAENAYDGLDLAFFAPDYCVPPTLEGNFVVLNFDKIPEPRICIGEAGGSRACHYSFAFDGQTWQLRFSTIRRALSRRFRFYPFVDAFFPSSYPDRLAGYDLVRTDHRSSPFLRRKVFKAPNAFVADVPFDYLAIYANSVLTLSDRVHACAVTLAYGKPAMLISRTPRARLLERVGAMEVTHQPVTVPKERIDKEKAQLLHFLKGVIQE